jgi:hypothetical protein
VSAIRIYLDEDAAQRDLLVALRARDADVTCAQDEGLMGSTDREQLDWCGDHGRVIYTFNIGDFHALHTENMASGRAHAGIILAPQQRYSIGEQMRRLLRLKASRTAEQMCNEIVFLSNLG